MQSKARAESIKLLATSLNALAIILLAAGLFGGWLDASRDLHADVRGWMIVAGLGLHALAHLVLRSLDHPGANADG